MRWSRSCLLVLQECKSFCTAAGASIFALEYGHQCFCGTDETDFEVYGLAVCDIPCAGSPDTVCGGYDAMSVYNIEPEAATTPTAPPTTPTAPPTTASPISSDDKSEISSSSSASSEKEVYPDYRPSSMSTEPIFSEGRPSSAYYSSSGGETSHDATVGSHLGCYLDVRHDRLLRSDMTESEHMTPAVCGAFCGEGGSEVFSLQYSTECWCGDEASFSGAVEADDSLCDYECAGDDTLRCGGYLYADVYRIEME
ncbi:unnamed protein product [Ectocarpus fasciculatus]